MRRNEFLVHILLKKDFVGIIELIFDRVRKLKGKSFPYFSLQSHVSSQS